MITAALTYLERDILRHLTHLKYLALLPDATAQGIEDGVIVRHPVASTSWDSEAYAGRTHVVMPTASTPDAARALLAFLERDDPRSLVFKFCDTLTQDVFDGALQLQTVRTFASYTAADEIAVSPDTEVVESRSFDDTVAALYGQNGYERDDMLQHFAEGARSFTLYEGDAPASSCFVYRNFGDVWEIAGVHTAEWARRKGYGRRVVQSAVSALLVDGKIPRYHVQLTNTASVHLAETLGLRRCLTLEHMLVSQHS